jgi:response regulator RpfG family c-di-GMP phosphodiesterase
MGEEQARAILEEEAARGWRDPALIRAFFDWCGRPELASMAATGRPSP